MFIYFIAKTLASGEKDANELGWMRIAVERWVSPDRNDIRLVTTTLRFTNIPSGNWFLPARDLANSVGGEPYKFKKIVDSGQATWIENPLLGEEGTLDLVESIMPDPSPDELLLNKIKIEEASPLYSIQDIRHKARAAVKEQKRDGN